MLKGALGILAAAPPLVPEFCPKSLHHTTAYAVFSQAVLTVPYAKVYDLAEAKPAPRRTENLFAFKANSVKLPLSETLRKEVPMSIGILENLVKVMREKAF